MIPLSGEFVSGSFAFSNTPSRVSPAFVVMMGSTQHSLGSILSFASVNSSRENRFAFSARWGLPSVSVRTKKLYPPD